MISDNPPAAKQTFKIGRSQLALLGGEPSITSSYDELFRWPLIGDAERSAVLDQLNSRDFLDGAGIKAFEREFAAAIGTHHAIAESSGTNAILAALFGCGVGKGDEVIVPTSTYWASCLPILSLRATPVFADINPETLTIDPDEVTRKITERTRAIVVVHLLGHPAEMDSIMILARRHGIRVVEDASHAY